MCVEGNCVKMLCLFPRRILLWATIGNDFDKRRDGENYGKTFIGKTNGCLVRKVTKTEKRERRVCRKQCYEVLSLFS